MAYKIKCGITANKDIQIVFDTIADFYKFEKRRKEKDEKHTIRGFVKETNTEIIFEDIYNNDCYEWFVVNGKFLNNLEPLRWHPLEDYLEDDMEI